MSFHSRLKYIVGVLCVLVCASAQISAQTFSNPVADLAAPFVLYSNGFYHLTGTTGGNVGLKKSTTLDGLKSAPLQVVFTPHRLDLGATTGHLKFIASITSGTIYFTTSEISSLTGQRTFVIEKMGELFFRGHLW